MDDVNISGGRLSSRRSPIHEGLESPSAETSRVEQLQSSSSSTSSSSSSSSRDKCATGEGFDLELFIRLDEKYQCPICMMVMREPVQTKCGHRFCETCLRRWLSKKRYSRCPVCQALTLMSEVFPDNFAKREIMSLLVRCLHYKTGCKQEMELRQLEEHQKECPYALVECPNGCMESIPRHRLEEHKESTCPMRYQFCPYCHKQFRASNAQVHKEECEESIMECKYCNKKFRKKEMERHVQSECPQVVIECMFQQFGCQEKFARSNEENHLRDEVVSHLSLLCSHFRVALPAEQLRFHDVTQSAPVITTTLASMTAPSTLGLSTDPGFCSDYSGTSTVFSTAPNRYPIAHSMEVLSSDAVLLPQPSHLAGTGTPAPAPAPVRRPALQPHGGRLNTYPLTPAPWPADESPMAAVVRLQSTVAEQRRQLEQQALKIQQQQAAIRQLEAQLRDVDGRFCNGVYVWRIHDYGQKRRDAIERKAVVHHSPGFYTSPHGYRMCVRANLNGVEAGVGTHMSLFVHLMQGDYDEVLPWPFRGQIRLSVLDQSGGRRDISETLFAKPGLAAFNKPTSKRNNKGFGYIEFAPLACFADDTYVRNDTMLVKVVVRPDEPGAGDAPS